MVENIRPAGLDTSTSAGFHRGLKILGMSPAKASQILQVSESKIKLWMRREPPHPVAAKMVEWMLDGYRPDNWHMSGPELRYVRTNWMKVDVATLADTLDVEDQTILNWESDDRGPPRLVAQAVRWIYSGLCPPEWPEGES